jgi:hypothetical protein
MELLPSTDHDDWEQIVGVRCVANRDAGAVRERGHGGADMGAALDVSGKRMGWGHRGSHGV